MQSKGSTPDRIEKRMKIGEKIRKTRVQKGLTQECLAEKVCIIQNSASGGNPQTISRIENAVNDFGIDTFLAVAEALEVPPESLLPDDCTEQTQKELIQILISRTEQKNEEHFRCLLSLLNQIINAMDI